MLFPDYDAFSPVVSTAGRVSYYSSRARERISTHAQEITRAARCIDSEATVDLRVAYKKLKRVQRKRLKHVWGQTDDTTIEISSARMQESYVVGTLLHEALHDCFTHGNGNPFTEEEEHVVMFRLGERE